MKSVKFNFFFLLIVTVLTTNPVFPGFSSLSGTPNFAHQDSLTSAMDIPNPSKTSQPSDTVLTRVSDVDTLSSEAAGKDLTDDLLLLLRNAIIRDTTSNRKGLNDEFYNREQYFSSYDGKKIVQIYINKVPVFGGSVDQPITRENTPVEQFGNTLHTTTKDQVIMDNLLFKTGDPVKPYQLAENERVIRNLPFIRDVRIGIVHAEEENGVNVVVTTQDVFSIGATVNARAVDDIAVSIYDRNFLGYGWQFRNTFRYRSVLDPPLDYEGTFGVLNIKGSFISASVFYKNTYDLDQIWIKLARPYVTQDTKYAGGVDLIQTTQDDELHDFRITRYKSHTQDYWLGRSVILGDPADRRAVKGGLRYYKKNYDRRPFTTADSNVVFHNQELYLGNILYSLIRYYTSTLIKGFGITEDVPVGYTFEFTGGYSDAEFKDRLYFGFEVNAATYQDHFGFLGGTGSIGSYNYQGEWQDGVFGVSLLYFSPLTSLNKYKFRQFIYADYTRGINRYDTKKINIGDEEGIRGLNHEALRGTESLTFNFESVTFTPWSLIGFQFAIYAFADAGWVGILEEPFAQNDFFSAIGLGCRIRNEGLVLRTLNLRVAYYPDRPAGASRLSFEISTSEPLISSPFRQGKPRILPFE